MFEKISPEAAGIPSENVSEFIHVLEASGAATHGILMMKGNQVFEEAYWEPFHKDYCHRMYSQTKSFVGIAIGLLEEEGKLALDDRIAGYFPDKIEGKLDPRLEELTIRDLLTMTTAGISQNWFRAGDPDRVHLYFKREKVEYPAGTIWRYDSPGSEVLAVLTERLSGMPLLEYLREKLFRELGTFRTAELLKTPNGDSWGDSAMVCTLRDMASFGRLLMQKGRWNGKQLIPEAYVNEATSKVVDNECSKWGSAFSQGYGYQIWRTEQNGFCFVGMGDQLTFCFPDKDLLFTICSDNQGRGEIREILTRAFLTLIAEKLGDAPLPENEEAYGRLLQTNGGLHLYALSGEAHSPLERELDGQEYRCGDNPLGMKRLSFRFTEEGGEFRYENAQGEKCIPFLMNRNVFGHFPQLGYSDEYGNVPTTNGFLYKDAVSACWRQPNRLEIYVQIIDRYFGNLFASFSFRGTELLCSFQKCAEAFLEEYQGEFMAEKV